MTQPVVPNPYNFTPAPGTYSTGPNGGENLPSALDPTVDPYQEGNLDTTKNVSKGAYNQVALEGESAGANAAANSAAALNSKAPTITNPYAQQSTQALSGLQGQQSATAAGMGQNIAELQAEASGKAGPTAADYAFTQGLGQSVAAQQAAAASAGGGAGASLAARGAAGNASNMEQTAVGQLGSQKANEQFAAEQALTGAQTAQAGVYQGQAGQEQAEYGLQQSTAQAQAAINQAQFAQDQQAAQGWSGQQTAGDTTQLNALEGFTTANAQQAGTAVNQQAVSNQATQADISTGAQFVGAVGSAASFISDERQKEDRRALDNPYDDHPIALMLGKLEPSAFRYKPEARAANGDDGREHVGIMAQDLERSPAGASVVLDTPTGKRVDTGAATAMSLAALAHHEDRLRALESKVTS